MEYWASYFEEGIMVNKIYLTNILITNFDALIIIYS
jgi:hypothetical protein